MFVQLALTEAENGRLRLASPVMAFLSSGDAWLAVVNELLNVGPHIFSLLVAIFVNK